MKAFMANSLKLVPDAGVAIVQANGSRDAAAWIAAKRQQMQDVLVTRGALLLRGFDVQDAMQFRSAVSSFSEQLLTYGYRSTPRHNVSDRVYTSTEYPPNETIPLHNENSYARSWPMHIWFCCITPAAEGGETPIADSRRVYDSVPADIRDELTRRRIEYVRNYGLGVDLPWEEAFQTNERAEVEAYCRAAGIEWTWGDGGRLQTRQVCDAVAVHPRTGEPVWFNQAHLFHVSSLDPSIAEALVSLFGEEGLPRNARFADGGAIDDSMMDAVRAAYAKHEVVFGWEQGDILVADNMLTAHARRPFRGARSVVVAMTDEQRAAS